VDIVAEAAKLQEAMASRAKRPKRLEHRGTGATPARVELKQPLWLTPWGRPAGAAQSAPPSRSSEPRPVGAMQITPLGWSQKKDLVGVRRSAPPAKRRRRPSSLGAGVEGVAEESAQRAPMGEEAHVPEPAEAQDEGVVAVMTAPTVTAQATTDSVILVVQLPDSSEEYGDSRDIDPAAAASATDKIAEFTSACAEVLDEGTSEGS